MPLIVAKKPAPCSVCGGNVRKGELAQYERALGLLHAECSAEAAAAVRRNGKRAACSECGAMLEKGQGRLSLHEQERPDGTWSHKWTVTCLDGCPTAQG